MGRRLIERYILGALLPYQLLALLVLTVVLSTQQSARYAEILGGVRAPWSLALEIMLALLPNILIFTLPMAMLVGTATGFSRMGSDSELTAMRAAGVGTQRILWPVLLLGALVSVLTFYIGFELAPPAAQELREAGMRAALSRLESPVEPRSFNAEMPGKVIYVRDGDMSTGQWKGVFIYWQEEHPGSTSTTRLITARTGRIDSTGEQTELLLNDALVTTLPAGGLATLRKGMQVTTERSAQLRIRDDRLSLSRTALLKKMNEREPELDEMGWRQLLERTRAEGREADRRNATIALHKRLALCAAPLVFALYGVGLGLRIRRGGRALGVGLSLAAMIVYYLVSLAGEQLARASVLPPALGAWLPFVLSAAVSLALISRQRRSSGPGARAWWWRRTAGGGQREVRLYAGNRPLALLGLLDRSVLKSLSVYFAGTFLLMVAIFNIFTLFELLKYISWDRYGISLLCRYLFFLLPLVSVSIAPFATLISVLVTFALLVRRSEAIAWWGCGQSVYRLVVPCIVFSACVGLAQWLVQERLLPGANRRQNSLRTQLRGGAMVSDAAGGWRWVAAPEVGRLYSYRAAEGSPDLNSPTVYEFDGEGIHLTRIVEGASAYWSAPARLEVKAPKVLEMRADGLFVENPPGAEPLEGVEQTRFIKQPLNTPAELNAPELSRYISTLKKQGAASQVQTLSVALEKKKSDPISPLVLGMVAAPLALAFGRRGALAALFVAVLVGLSFWAATSGLQQVGLNGMLPPTVAAWGPTLIYLSVGVYLLSRSRT